VQVIAALLLTSASGTVAIVTSDGRMIVVRETTCYKFFRKVELYVANMEHRVFVCVCRAH